MIENRAEPPVVFLACFVQVGTQAVGDVLIPRARRTSFGRSNLMSCMATLAMTKPTVEGITPGGVKVVRVPLVRRRVGKLSRRE